MSATQTSDRRVRDERKTAHARVRPVRALDDLAVLSLRELDEVYAAGTVPETIAALDGDLVGRMLAIRTLDRGAPFRALSSFARSSGFPWGGKSFHALDAAHGTGINRVHLGGRHRLFPFATHVGPSVIDARPCVVLDYDQPENPSVIRAIHDEVREVAPRIFLGPACVKRKGRDPLLVLFFALEARAG